jgi:hypothetical protein
MPSISRDYSGRTFSLSITDMQLPETRIARIGFSTNQSVTGIQKLLERYIVLLLETLGSSLYSPAEGTNLVNQTTSGQVLTSGQAQGLLGEANTQAMASIHSEDTPSDMPDERLKTSTATLISLSGGMMTVSIQIETQAGTKLQFVLPTNIAIP